RLRREGDLTERPPALGALGREGERVRQTLARRRRSPRACSIPARDARRRRLALLARDVAPDRVQEVAQRLRLLDRLELAADELHPELHVVAIVDSPVVRLASRVRPSELL